MMPAVKIPALVDTLPEVRGEYVVAASLADLTWFRVGGLAEVVYRPADEADLVQFLKQRPADLPITVMGVGSNLLVRDGGLDGVVIRLGRGFGEIEIEDTEVRAGAGAPDVGVAMSCAASGVAGFEFLRGIPGTIGGALRMNAGAFGSEMKDVVVRARAVDGGGKVHRLDNAGLGFAYRHCAVPQDWIFTAAVMRGRPGNRDEIAKAMEQVAEQRLDAQPVRSRTGGSTFVNPPAEISGGRKAWQLIDEAGCRGLTIGGAKVSEQHCNFLINEGTATAADLEALGEDVRARVLSATGIELQWELKIIGKPLAADGGSRTSPGVDG